MSATRPGQGHPWATVVRQVAADRVDRAVFVAVLVVVGFGDSILLPFDFTQRISFANWRYLDARYLAFTLAFALAMAWVLTLQVHAVRGVLAARSHSVDPRRSGPLGALAAVVSLLPSFLCCSPVVPTLVGLFGLSAATRLRTTGTITYFFATEQNLLLLGALALVVASGLWSTRKVARAGCFAGACSTPAEDTTSAQVLRGRPEPSPAASPGAAIGVGSTDHAPHSRRPSP
ncbi:MAG: hypothetical protein M0Z42_22735 [Actinomycetota bacterium]|nr:hypothetical protein [Actinomycetota bacterium]